MSLSLRPHPSLAAGPAIVIEAEATRSRGGRLALRYLVTGDLGGLYLPPAGRLTRADELWKRTCFEAFIRPEPDEAYFEFNIAPTRWWAAYRFDGYRQAMADVDIAPPVIEAHTHDDRFELTVALDLPDLPEAPWRVALTAVIEALNGDKSYWALAHPPEKPDFHHADGFVLEL